MQPAKILQTAHNLRYNKLKRPQQPLTSSALDQQITMTLTEKETIRKRLAERVKAIITNPNNKPKLRDLSTVIEGACFSKAAENSGPPIGEQPG